MTNNNVSRLGIPKEAKLVFKGVIFEVWQWEQKMFDGTVQTFERIWRPSTVMIISTVDDKILIEAQDQPDKLGNINLPGGRVDDEENPLAEAKRELQEETGYESDDWGLLMKHEKIGKMCNKIYYFIARNCRKTKEPNLDAGEKIETKFISFEDLFLLVKDPHFWVPESFTIYLLRINSDVEAKEKLRKSIFGK